MSAATPDAAFARARLTMLAALLFAALPAVTRLPWWLSLLLAALLLPRLAGEVFALQGRSVPAVLRPWPPLALLGLLPLAAYGILGEFQYLVGSDGGGAALLLLAALKAHELRRPRDLRVLALVGYFALLTHLFYGQGMGAALHAVLGAFALTAALVGLSPVGAGAGARVAARRLLLAVPLGLVMFVLFPRPDGPLWRMTVEGSTAQTGLSGEMTPGAYAALANSDAVAFRADFAGAIPPSGALYWRGPVMEGFDGRTWRQLPPDTWRQLPPDTWRQLPRTPLTAPAQVVIFAPPLDYVLHLEPHGQPWLLALDIPGAALPAGTWVTPLGQLVARGAVNTRERHRLQAHLDYRLNVQELPTRLALNTQAPTAGNARAAALAQGWRGLPEEKRVQAALALLGGGEYRYTLNPGTFPPGREVDALLFERKRGFCEHYAGAFAFLMRQAGVPARVVGGYLGGQDAGGYLIVRQLHAHAWTEVWLAGRGWVRVDPTAAVAPARLSEGLAAALDDPLGAPRFARDLGGWQQLSLGLDRLRMGWDRWIVGFDGERQRTLLSRLGVGVGGGAYALLGLLLGALALAPALLAAWRARAAADPALRTLDAAAARLGLPRGPGEGATSYADRASEALPHRAAELQTLAHRYQALRYAPGDHGSALRDLQRFARRLPRERRRKP